ncbi:MAG: hypothetical protein C5B59_07935 [Bacteroidetes bacterium]|nr:MAG: hypothetical protein C5B59_07935 [Bacteroidota bacterium]
MGLHVDIYGSLVELPEVVEYSKVETWGTDNPKEQYWRRRELPDFFHVVEYDKDENLLLTPEQDAFAYEERRRCREGFYFMNNGVVTYITGKNYFYLQWWKLEDDIYPSYRDTDRRYFLFLDHWEKIKWCLGILRGKKRREGASSQATANLMYECIFFRNTVAGMVSKTEKDTKTTFTQMVAFGYRQLPAFFKPKQTNSKDSVSEFVFAQKSESTKGGGVRTVMDADTGHRSKVDYRAPGPNTYDSGRLTRGLFDEGGKWPVDVPFSQFISIVSKTMVKGGRRVGFMECPSTINEMTKGGGAEYRKVWGGSDQHKLIHGRTPRRMVRYFTPAYDGYEGFIDRYGMSVIDKPTEEQYQYLVENFVGVGDLTEEDIALGAKEYLTRRRDGLSGMELEEEIRQNPFNEEEMFMFAGFGCEFNAINLQRQIKDLEDTPPVIRRFRMIPKKMERKARSNYGKDEVKNVCVPMEDAKKGGWYILEHPNIQNHFSERADGFCEPLNTMLYQIGVDTTRDLPAVHGSKPVIVVMKKSFIVDGQETGMYPVAMWLEDTRLDIHFDEQVLLACKYYGCKANYEIDARGDYYRYFMKKKCGEFLNWTPSVAMNPVKRNPKKEPGTRSGDPFQLAQQLQVAKMYIDGTDNDEYNGHVHRIKYVDLLYQLMKYDHAERTPFDQVIALMMALLPMTAETVKPMGTPDMIKKKGVLPRFKIKMPAQI